ncbi:MAG: hypothetical protein U1E39_07765 [Planctomycetota bacterium]
MDPFVRNVLWGLGVAAALLGLVAAFLRLGRPAELGEEGCRVRLVVEVRDAATDRPIEKASVEVRMGRPVEPPPTDAGIEPVTLDDELRAAAAGLVVRGRTGADGVATLVWDETWTATRSRWDALLGRSPTGPADPRLRGFAVVAHAGHVATVVPLAPIAGELAEPVEGEDGDTRAYRTVVRLARRGP